MDNVIIVIQIRTAEGFTDSSTVQDKIDVSVSQAEELISVESTNQERASSTRKGLESKKLQTDQELSSLL